MARKQRSGESTDVYFDTRTKAVLTQTSYNSMANVKEQLTCVREVVPHCKKEDIVLILQHFDGDVPKTIQAFMEGVAEGILKEWNVPSKRKTGNNVSKKNKKKSNKQTMPQEDGTPVPNGVQEEHIPCNNNIDKPIEPKLEAFESAKDVGMKQIPSTQQSKLVSAETTHQHENQHITKAVDTCSTMSVGSLQQRKPQQHQGNNSKKAVSQSQGKGHPPRSTLSKPQEPREHQKQVQSQRKNPRQGSARDSKQHHGNKVAFGPTLGSRTGNDDQSGQRSSLIVPSKQGQSSEGSGKRERNMSESSSVTDMFRSKKTGATLDKSSKDLHRTAVSLTRHKNLLAEEIEKAEKRLKKAFDDAKTSLSTREEDLMKQIQEVKRHATALLEDRQHKAFELKQEISRSPSKSEHELLELRADIKHFVSERKIDEEIGRSSRFTGNLDALQQAIKNFGEVLGVKNVYSARRNSLTSLASMDSLSRPTTSISDDHSGPLSTPSSTLEGSVKTGHDTASMPVAPLSPASPDTDMDSEVAKLAAKMQRSMQGPRGRGPRNPRQHADNTRQGQQGNNKRQGHPATEANRQDQLGFRDQQDGKRQNKRIDKKPRNETGHQGHRNERPRNDRQRNDRGEGGRGKEEPRNKDRIIRRREQYRRRHDQEPEDGSCKDIKKDTCPVSQTDGLPLPQKGPSPANINKNTSVIENTSDKPKPQSLPEKKVQVLNIPLVNGNGSSSIESWPTEALPQRKPHDGRRVKMGEVVKDVTSMNGMMNGDSAPVMLNSES